jgi:hypothetical protein
VSHLSACIMLKSPLDVYEIEKISSVVFFQPHMILSLDTHCRSLLPPSLVATMPPSPPPLPLACSPTQPGLTALSRQLARQCHCHLRHFSCHHHRTGLPPRPPFYVRQQQIPSPNNPGNPNEPLLLTKSGFQVD